MSENKKLNIVIATGGTGGHLLPAQKLTDKLLQKSNKIQITLAGFGLKKRHFFDPSRYQIYEISSGPISKNPRKMLKSLFAIGKGIFKAYFYLRKNSFDLVVGMGSYHAFPVLFAAKLLKKKIILFEQNRILGQVNQFFSKKAKCVALQFPLEKPIKNATLVEMKSNPLFSKIKKKQEGKTLLIFGGSQGAQFFNEFFLNFANQFHDLKIIHLTGNDQMTDLCKKKYDSLKIDAIVKSYDSNIFSLYQQADFAVCRSGANTLLELMHCHLPAIVIPYPYAKDQHQLKNGLFFQNVVRGGVCVEQSKIDQELFYFLLGEFKASLTKYAHNIERYQTNEKQTKRILFSELILQIGSQNE